MGFDLSDCVRWVDVEPEGRVDAVGGLAVWVAGGVLGGFLGGRGKGYSVRRNWVEHRRGYYVDRNLEVHVEGGPVLDVVVGKGFGVF